MVDDTYLVTSYNGLYKFSSKSSTLLRAGAYFGLASSGNNSNTWYIFHFPYEKSEKYNYVLYKFIRENNGFDNFNMVLVEKYTECKDRLEARQREQYWIDELQSQLNEQRAFYAISKNEYDKRYRDEHKEELKLYFKKRYEDNKDKIKEQGLQKITCDCGKIFGIYKKPRHEKSQYHKDYIKQLAQEDSC